MIEDALQRFVDAADGNLQESMDNDIQDRQKSQTYIAEENGQLSLCSRIVRCEFLAELLMECHVLVIPAKKNILISIENGWVEFFEQTNCSVSSDRANFPERIPLRDSEAHLILATTIEWCRSILVPRCLPVCATPNKRPIDQVWTHCSSKWVRWRYRRAS